MPPKNKFKKINLDEFEPKKPSIPNFVPGGTTFVPGSGTFVPGGSFVPSGGYESGSSNNVSGTSTPVNGGSSISLASLGTALKDIENTPASEYFEKIVYSQNISEVKGAVGELTELLEKEGAQSIDDYNVHGHWASVGRVKGSALAREGAMVALSAIAKKFGPETPAEAHLLQSFTLPFDLLADKDNSVKRAAQACSDALYGIYPDEGKVSGVLTKLFEYLSSSAKWQGKVGALKFVERILEDVPQDFLESRFVDAIPVLTNVMHDMKPELSRAATKTLTEFGNKLDNQDVVPRVPLIIKTLDDPKNVQNCIKSLSQVTFVTEVTESALAILVPILNRALNATSSTQESLRQTVIVVENLTRLVHNPREVKAFIPDLLPGVSKVYASAAQPEVRNLAEKAKSVLEEAEKDSGNKTRITKQEAEQQLDSFPAVLKEYVSNLVVVDVNTREFKKLEAVYKNYLKLEDGEAQERVGHFKSMFADSAQADTVEDGIEIVNAEFSLAYGGRMLLNKTILRLFKGHRYGLCGRNGAGKSTLMRSIAEGKLEGFPDKSELRTCFVEHKLQGSEADLDIISFIASDPDLASIARSDISKALHEVGFDDERQQQKVGSLSGGWKMKLELARAVLMKADVLLLDEPTNHLDVKNVQWLIEYLNAHTEITSLIVSHDSGFLDAVCTDIIHYESKKLVYYKGNLSE